MRMKFKWVVLLICLVLLGACAPVSEREKAKQVALGDLPDKVNFLEAKQIVAIEQWKDDPGKIVNVYILNPATGGLWIPTIRCVGVPTSSTESIEPNIGSPYVKSSGGRWRVPIDGIDVLTEEMSGRDGTYGDPIAYRQCMDVTGQYHDWSQFTQVVVSSADYAFSEATVKRDFEAEARLLQAEEILKNGGCIDTETLLEKEC